MTGMARSRFAKLACFAVMFAMLFSIFPSLVAAEDPANAPDWQQGDKWAWGGAMYMDSSENDQISELEDMVTAMNGTIEKLYYNGSIETYAYAEVEAVTADEYQLLVKAAVHMSAEADVKVSLELPSEGTYIMGEAPVSQKTIQLKADLEFVIYEEMHLNLEKDTRALKQATSFTKVILVMSASADNIPEMNFEWNEQTQQVMQETSYKSYDVSADIAIFINLTASFSPALNIYDFPIYVGEEWDVYSTATLGGDLSGHIDVEGLPASLEEEMGDEVQFPINLGEYTGDLGDMQIVNGVVQTVTQDVQAHMHCVGMVMVDDDFFGNVSVYKIEVNDGEGYLYYSPEIRLFRSMEASVDDITEGELGDITDELPIPIGTDQTVGMELIDPDEAEENIQDISAINSLDGSGSGGISGSMIFLAILAGLIIAALILLAVVMRKKKGQI